METIMHSDGRHFASGRIFISAMQHDDAKLNFHWNEKATTQETPIQGTNSFTHLAQVYAPCTGLSCSVLSVSTKQRAYSRARLFTPGPPHRSIRNCSHWLYGSHCCCLPLCVWNGKGSCVVEMEEKLQQNVSTRNTKIFREVELAANAKSPAAFCSALGGTKGWHSMQGVWQSAHLWASRTWPVTNIHSHVANENMDE